VLEFLLPILHDQFLQVLTNSTTTTIPQQLQTAATGVTSQVDNNTTGIVATVIGTAGTLLGKHLYDSKKRGEVVQVASDIDKMQMVETADNYNDFAQMALRLELLIRLILSNADKPVSEILSMEADTATHETVGMQFIRYCQDIQRYNVEYYKNTAFKSNSIIYNSKNPLKNVRNLVADMSTPTPS